MVVVTAIIATGATVAGYLGISAVAGGFFAAGTGAFLLGLGTQIVLGLALNALTPKPSIGSSAARGYQVNSRGSALDHAIIYGRAKVGGAILFDDTTGSNNRYLHRVIAVAGHEIESFDEIYINDELITIDGLGNVTSPTRYDGKVRIKLHLGSPTQTADTDLVSEVTAWTTNHRLRGIAYMYVRFNFDADVFPNGIPTITTVVSGKKVYNPDTGLTVWSDNPALCLRDYLSSTGYGLGEADANIDDTLVTAAAVVCAQTNTTATTTRYTSNGTFTTSITPFDLINSLLTSMGGSLWYSQGKWRMKPAYWTASVLALDEDDLRSSIAVATRHSRRDNFNTVKGTFRGSETNWQVTDYPEVTNAAFVTADNGQVSTVDIDLPFTDNSIEARRIGRIGLEGNRQQLMVSASFGLRALAVQVGDNISLTNTRFGWTSKAFQVVSWNFGLTDGLDLQVEMTLKETAETVFDETDDGIIYERDNTTLLSPFEVPAIGIGAVATTQVLREKLTNIINVTITSGRPEGIDRVEVEFKETTDTNYISLGTGEIGLFRAVDLDTGSYDFRARATNTFGVRGDWGVLVDIEANGLLGAPDDVTGFTAELNGPSIYLEWEPIASLDLSYYRIRHSIEETGATYANATTAVDKVPRPANSVSVPARSGTYHIKSIDKSGVTSENYTSIVVPAAALEQFTTTTTQTEDPTFSGTKTGCSVTTSTLRITTPTTAPTTATYDFSAVIDTTTPRLVRARVDMTVVRVDNSAGLWDDIVGNFDSIPGLFDDFTGAVQFGDANVKTYISITQDDPTGSPTWTDYQAFRAGDYYGRAFRFRAILTSTSDNITPSISALDAIVEYN
jgi:hypothetical protein